MFLTRFIYVSRPRFAVRPPCLDGELAAIAKAGLDHNPRNQITGVLAIDSECFVQALEGARPAVSQTGMRIARDPRHSGFELISMEEINERAFPDWSVAFLDRASLPPAEPRYASFDSLTSEALLQRLLRVRRTGVIACRTLAAA
ncbi:MAG: BLUF domain-containing protein [Oceanicaulis sp.]